jgi:hypothetical protein
MTCLARAAASLHPRECLRALAEAVALSFPRRVWSPGERLARSRLLRRLREQGLSPWTEPFAVTSRGEVLSRWHVWLAMAALFLAWLMGDTWPKTAGIVALIPLLGVLVSRWVWLELGLRFPPKEQRGRAATANILAEVRGRQAPAEPLVVWLLAHYDTKSYPLSASLRITAAMVLPVAGVIMAGADFGAWTMSASGWCLGAAVAAALLLSPRSGNESPGALDNGAAVGLVLALAGHYQRRPPRATVIRVAFTGAEEMGLLGAFALREAHREDLGRGRHVFINLDGIGCAGGLRIFGSRSGPLTRAFLRAGRQTGVGVRRGRLPPTAMMDHEVLARAGFPSVSLGGAGRDLRKIHSPRDHQGLIDLRSLWEAGQLLRHAIDSLDEPADGEGLAPDRRSA